MPSDFEIELKLLLDGIFLKYHYDFRQYAPASIKRRLIQAMTKYGCATLSALQEKVLRQPDVFHDLLSYLTIQVSDMFRDPSYFLSLRQKVVPYLQTYPSLKVWIPGCSAGEEVYSMAIMLHEEGLLEKALIYATDINPDALHQAERGVYKLDRITQFTGAYREGGGRASLADYYTAAYGSAVFDRRLRQGVVFSDHSLTTDSVFAEIQLISCRNVLIYFNRELQDRAIGLFSESLVRKGFLGLGARETLKFTSHAGEFTEFVPADRIYQKT